jgi:hypothetical protein
MLENQKDKKCKKTFHRNSERALNWELGEGSYKLRIAVCHLTTLSLLAIKWKRLALVTLGKHWEG